MDWLYYDYDLADEMREALIRLSMRISALETMIEEERG